MSIYTEMLKRIRDEINLDPRKLGYGVKTSQEKVDLLNNVYAIITSSETVLPPPINQILAGIESAPNAVDTNLLTLALAYAGT